MLLFFAYSLKDDYEILAEILNIDEYTNNDINLLDAEIFKIKIKLLQKYYGDPYYTEIYVNKHIYEEDFDQYFEYNYWVLP